MITDELLLAAQRKLEESQPAAARELYLKVLAMDASHAVANRALAAIAYEEGNLPVAADFMLRSANADAQAGASWVEAGILLQAAHRPVEAKAALQKARAWLPDNFDVIVQIGDLHRDGGELSAAVECYEQALVVQPGHARAQCNLADLFWRQGNLGAARLACQAALSLDPSLPEAHNTLGNIESAAGDYPSATLAFAAAVQLNPEFAAAHNNLGLAQFELGLLHDAQASFQKAVQLAPGFSQARTSLGDVLDRLGQPDEALKQLEAALKIDPEDAIAHWNAGNIAWKQGRHDDAASSFRAAMAILPDVPAVHSNLLYAQQYDMRLSGIELIESARAFANHFEAPLRAFWPKHINTSDPDRVIRVGYLSADLRTHPVAHFMAPIFANRSKCAFEVVVYYNHLDSDSVTLGFKERTDEWFPCAHLNDEQLAAQIFADRIDILVDLGGHTDGNRMLVFARKPAPIQITYLNYPGTTGLQSMDYRLTDALVDPPNNSVHYTERLLYLPRSMWCYSPAEYMPPEASLPAMANGHITFGSFNNFNKISPQSIALWSTVMRQVPTSRLMIVTAPAGSSRQNMVDLFRANGVSEYRIVWHGKKPSSEFVTLFNQVDIALDCTPMNGGTTTMEGLWMGVPTISLCGVRFFSRAGLSILSAAGHADWAPASPEEYVKIAVELATDVEALAQLRQGMRHQLAKSPLMNAGEFTAALESIYRQLWQKWCQENGD